MRSFNIKTIVLYLAVFVVIVAIGVTIINRLSAQESVVYPLPSEVIVAETPMVSQVEKMEAPVEPEPVNEEIPDEPAIDWEEPPVDILYNPEADLDDSGYIDRAEWERWLDTHPEDLNQDLVIDDWERAEFNKPYTPTRPASRGDTSKPTKSSGMNSNTKSTPKPVVTTPPESVIEAQKKADAESVGSEEDDLAWANSQTGPGMTYEEATKPFPPVQ